MFKRNLLRLNIAIFFLFIGHPSAWAQSITPVQELGFGTFALKNNSSRYLLRVSRLGVVTSDSQFVILSPPTPAEYSLSGFTPSTLLVVTIPDSTITVGGDSFDLESFTPTPGLTTDSSGNAVLRFGASLYSSGLGANYTNGSFSGTINITVNY